jgi:hypothetical protein
MQVPPSAHGVGATVVVVGGLQLGRVKVTIAECGVTFWLLWVRPSQSARIA